MNGERWTERTAHVARLALLSRMHACLASCRCREARVQGRSWRRLHLRSSGRRAHFRNQHGGRNRADPAFIPGDGEVIDHACRGHCGHEDHRDTGAEDPRLLHAPRRMCLALPRQQGKVEIARCGGCRSLQHPVHHDPCGKLRLRRRHDKRPQAITFRATAIPRRARHAVDVDENACQRRRHLVDVNGTGRDIQTASQCRRKADRGEGGRVRSWLGIGGCPAAFSRRDRACLPSFLQTGWHGNGTPQGAPRIAVTDRPGPTGEGMTILDPDQSNRTGIPYSPVWALRKASMPQDRFRTVQEIADRRAVATVSALDQVRQSERHGQRQGPADF